MTVFARDDHRHDNERPSPDTADFAYRGINLGSKGSLETRLADGAEEIEAAQALRYKVFYEEMSARPTAQMRASRLDADEFDDFCDHLLVIDHDLQGDAGGAVPTAHGAVVGTYRLLRQSIAEKHRGFYTTDEFEIEKLIASKPDRNFLELGRSCVLEPYRNRPTVELLWQGIWNFVRLYKLDVMVGCASLIGTDPAKLEMELSFLHHFCRAPADWDARAVAARRVDMNRLAKDKVDPRRALRALPPLIKGYLRLGATIGDGAVIDEQFNTTDVLIILPVEAIDPRYFEHFGGPDDTPLIGD